MKKVIIYGVGIRCRYILEFSSFFKMHFENKGFEVIGFSDGDSRKIKKEIRYNNKSYYVMPKNDCTPEKADYIIITSEKYFYEIKKELMMNGFKEDNILKLDAFIEAILNDVYHKEFFLGKKGIEIGGPSFIFKNLYGICSSCDGVNFSSETVWWKQNKTDGVEYNYGDKKLGKIFIADAIDMKMINDDSYDFLLSSNNLEHIANPLKALHEFRRIVRTGGVILIAVPIKEKTFDHRRNYTTFEHILSDYKNEIKEDDLTHLDEILELHDLNMDKQAGDFEAFKERSANNFQNRCIHHHVFSKDCLLQMYDYMNLSVIEFVDIFNNYVILGKVDSK